ncbi:hypothetical protein HDU97_002949 [Phlyctochytrium planicorne]|nr:hypothetical protein HDU97_002949 [Phlyctochytrium planicorne]
MSPNSLDRLLHTVQGAFLGSLIVLGVMSILAWTSSPDCSNDANRTLKAASALLTFFSITQVSVAVLHYQRQLKVKHTQLHDQA